MAHDAFISYSTKDRRAAEAICGALEGRGIRCWIAPRDIAAGADYAGSIIAAINDTKIMVLVFSHHANASRSVRNEVERAFTKEVTIVPIRIDDAKVSGALEFFLSLPQWLDAFEPPLEMQLDDLTDSVAAMLAGQVPLRIGRTSSTLPEESVWVRNRTRLVVGGVVAAFIVAVLTVWSVAFHSTARDPAPVNAGPAPAAVEAAQPASVAPPPMPPVGEKPPPQGQVYGASNHNARVILRAHKSTRILVQGADGMVYINRTLEPGDTYQVPNLAELTLSTTDGKAVEIDLDGQVMGYASPTAGLVVALSLDPQKIVDRASPVTP